MDYINTWKEVILNPAEFYWKMPTTEGYADPLIFAAINYIISWLLSLPLLVIIFIMYGLKFSFSEFGVSFVLIGLVFLVVFASLLITSLIANLIYKSLGGTGSYEGTLRFSSYASAALVFLSIPFIVPVAMFYELYLLIVGGMIVHNVSMSKSTTAVFLSFCLPSWMIIILSCFEY